MNRKLYAILLGLFSFVSFSYTIAQCTISGVEATVLPCDGGVFYVTLNFEYEEVGPEGFSVVGNGNDYGDFEYGSLPIEIGPLEGDGITEYEFVVIDNLFGDCQNWTGTGPVFCGVGDCGIDGLVVEATECDGDNSYDIVINFEAIDPTDDHFDVIYDDVFIGYFALSELPVTIENFEDNGEPFPIIQVCINDNPDCCAITEFEAPSCGNCEIGEIEAVELECVDDEFWITLNFEYINTGNDGFIVQGNGVNYGSFLYDNLPITIGPLPANNTFYEFVVVDGQFPDCSSFIEYGIVDCSGGSNCEIWDLVFDAGECDPATGTYNLWINFEFQNATNDLFDVIYNDEIIGTYELAGLPILIENFTDNGEPYPLVEICINDNFDCCTLGEFESPCEPAGGDCEIWDVFAEAHECDADGFFMVDIEFNSNNTGAEGFSIVANGEEFGPFEYGEPFYTFGPLEGDGAIYEILVVDNQFNDCGGFFELGPIYCGENCHIYDLEAETTECDDMGQFYVVLNFEYQNVGNDGFKVVGNGNVYGFFDYGDLPIEIGPFQTPIDDLEFIVTDVQQPDCGDFIGVEAPNCDGNPGGCEIWDMTADVTPCSNDGTFYVIIDFEHNNTSEIAFSVNGNGISYGFYAYDDLPISIGPLVGNGTTPYEFGVSDILMPDCGAGIEVGPVECDGLGDCQITNFVADASACNDDGTYDLWLNFSYSNSPNIYFDVIYQGDIIDYFPLAELPVIISHFPGTEIGPDEITVCINDTPGCCVTTEFEAPDCLGPNLVWPGDTESNNVSNHFDLLNIGLAFGSEGPERSVQGIEWTGLLAEQWDEVFPNGLNQVHADCDGNGVVDENDIAALEVNFNETHGDVIPPVLIGGSEDDSPLYVDLLGAGALIDGQQFSASIMLGTEDFPVEEMYGLAFTLEFDPEVIDPNSIQLMYDPSWLGVENVNLITFDQSEADEGKVHVALSRSDQNNVSGHGHIAAFIGIIDNIAGKEAVQIGVTQVKAITVKQALVPLTKPVQTAGIVTSTNEPVIGEFKVFPNPASTEVTLVHPLGIKAENVRLKNINGVVIQIELSGNNQLNIGDLADGIYFLEIETAEGLFLEKLVKM